MVINFTYPQIYETDYLRSCVRLEIGPLAQWLPSHGTIISSYVSEYYPNLFQKNKIKVLTVDAKRSFWEKITILHEIANFPNEKKLPPRYARHLYDVYCLINSDVKKGAIENFSILEDVVKFKDKFYYSKHSNYENATIKKINLTFNDKLLKELKDDYIKMREMIYGDYPDFDLMINSLIELEKEIHSIELIWN